ncbi:MAG: aspartate/glutamate racemase family protein [Tistlia sp.]
MLLNTRFPRLPGDIGNPASFDRPVLYRRVAAASVAAVARPEGIEPALAEAILAAGRALVAEGAAVIATSCGFLGELQARLAAALPVPVAASALSLLPQVRARHGAAARLGILTFDARRLTPRHFGGHWSEDLLVEGLEQGRTLYPAIAEDRAAFDPAAAEADVAEAAARLLARAGRLDAVVLECTNIGPYAARVRAVTGAAVYDLVGSLRAQPEVSTTAQGTRIPC